MPEALRAFEPPLDGPTRMRPAAAEHFRIERHFEELEGILSGWAWCCRCGVLFQDGRVIRGDYIATGVVDGVGVVDEYGLAALIGGVAKWCSLCRHSRRRHLPATRTCLAVDCASDFVPRRADHLTCCGACKKALGALRRRHASARRLAALGGPPIAFLPCIKGAYPLECECPWC